MRHLPPGPARLEGLAHPAPVAPTDDPARAARRIMTDDGFNIGVLYKGNPPRLRAACLEKRHGSGPGKGVSAGKKPKPSTQYADFMSRAYTMELEATERYTQFAEQLETHNNREVASLFRKLAEIEKLHAKRILEEMQWPSVPALAPAMPGKVPKVPRPRRSIRCTT